MHRERDLAKLQRYFFHGTRMAVTSMKGDRINWRVVQ